MPISNPSYFPPSRSNGSIVGITAGVDFTGARSFLGGANAGNHSALNDIILLGDNVMPVCDSDGQLIGSTVIGSQALKSLQFAEAAADGAGANTVLGGFAGENLIYGGANVLIGDSAMLGTVGVFSGHAQQNVVIGSKAALNIGTLAANPTRSVVVIGEQAAAGRATGSLVGSIVIGQRAAFNMSGVVQASTLIGTTCFGSLTSANDVHSVGTMDGLAPVTVAALGSGSIESSNTAVVIGNVVNVQATETVCIGAQIISTLDLCVVIGNNAARDNGALTNKLLVEVGRSTTTNATRRLIWGDFGTNGATDGGNIAFGDVRPTVNDDFPANATNIVKLINGTVGTVNPVGGGYFYVTGGFLHWVDSAGTDTQLSITATGELASSALTAYTNNAAAQLGTLTNAPTAGNPTKWIPINDNGTIRNIPAW